MTSVKTSSTKSIWGQARGDHMITAAIFSSLGLTLIFAMTIFTGHEGLEACLWFFFSGLLGVLIPLWLVPTEWIDNSLPKGHFWRDLICQ